MHSIALGQFWKKCFLPSLCSHLFVVFFLTKSQTAHLWDWVARRQCAIYGYNQKYAWSVYNQFLHALLAENKAEIFPRDSCFVRDSYQNAKPKPTNQTFENPRPKNGFSILLAQSSLFFPPTNNQVCSNPQPPSFSSFFPFSPLLPEKKNAMGRDDAFDHACLPIHFWVFHTQYL